MSNLSGSTNPYFMTLQIVADCLCALGFLTSAITIAFYANRRADGPARTGSVATAVMLATVAFIQIVDIWATLVNGHEIKLCIKVAAGLSAMGMGIVVLLIYPHTPNLRLARALELRNKELEAQNMELKKTAETALEAVDVRMAFLANVSHELRTPLSAVISMNELLLNAGLNAEQRKLAQACDSSAQSILAMVSDIQDLTSLESGLLRLELAPVRIDLLIRDSIAACIDSARRKKLFINTDIDPRIPESVLADQRRLQQVLVRLLKGAIHYTDSGGIVVHASLDMTSATELSLRLSVRDTGVGLTGEEQKSLFEPFAGEETRRRYAETGLGMYMAKLLVHLMGGEIGVESKKAHGTTFWFRVNVGAVPRNQASVAVIAQG